MRLLFVVPYAPTLIRTRPHNLVRELARRGHQVTLATLWENPEERDALQALEREGVVVHAERLTRLQTIRNSAAALTRGEPLQASYCWQSALTAYLRRVAGEGRFDVAHVEHLRGARYALALKPMLPTVWDSVDCISHLFEQASAHSRSWRGRLMTLLELGRTRKHEGWLVRQFERVLITSRVDKAAIERLAYGECGEGAVAGQSPVVVLPNGVDLKRFKPSRASRQPDTLVLSGKMSYHANVTAALYFVNEILPLVWQERPQVRLWIVGQSPPAAVKRLGSDSRVVVTGYVPDIGEYLGRAAVAVCPIVYGAGSQYKVLEAMACATPVVSHPIGVSALNVRIGEEVLTGETPHEFAQQVLRLLADGALAKSVGEAGRQFVEREHGWSMIAGQLEKIYEEVIHLWNCLRRR